jgi:small GTP-binding protein
MSYRGKVILCGDPGVGKTSLLARYVDGKFSEEYHQTIGANFLIKDVKPKGFKLYFWDLGGQHDKLFSNEYYFIQAVGAMVIFSLNQYSSFNNVDFWISKLKDLSGDIPYILVGNKNDLDREIDREMVEEKLEQLGVSYFETSAKLNENVDNAFETLSIQILNNLK